MAPKLIALFGPTAVGKTAVAVALADRLRALGARPVAVSADALQVYAGLERLTGVADAAEQARLEHRLISFLPVHESYSVGAYAERAHAEVDGLLACGALPIVLGGTGLYLRAALTELSLRPAGDPAIRRRLAARVEALGPQPLHAELAERAPWAAAGIEPGDRHRVMRALELLEAGALTPPAERSELWTADTRHPTVLIGLERERAELYARIDARVEAIVAAGAAQEVRAADAAGASPTARRALGFDELLSGDVAAMKRRTRRYARRQLTWMRKLAAVHRFDLTGRSAEDSAAEIVALWLTAAETAGT